MLQTVARPVSEPLANADVRERLVAAALRLLRERGAAELTVRRVAEMADSSTMGIYSRFGSRAGMVGAVYRRGFQMLREALTAARDAMATTDEPVDRIVALGVAYRRFALDNPALYGLMFERPLPDFDPSPELRTEALGTTFGLLVDEVDRAVLAVADEDPLLPAYMLWTVMHGMTSIELTHAARSPLPGWFIDSAETGERVLVGGVRALLAGLR